MNINIGLGLLHSQVAEVKKATKKLDLVNVGLEAEVDILTFDKETIRVESEVMRLNTGASIAGEIDTALAELTIGMESDETTADFTAARVNTIKTSLAKVGATPEDLVGLEEDATGWTAKIKELLSKLIANLKSIAVSLGKTISDLLARVLASIFSMEKKAEALKDKAKAVQKAYAAAYKAADKDGKKAADDILKAPGMQVEVAKVLTKGKAIDGKAFAAAVKQVSGDYGNSVMAATAYEKTREVAYASLDKSFDAISKAKTSKDITKLAKKAKKDVEDFVTGGVNNYSKIVAKVSVSSTHFGIITGMVTGSGDNATISEKPPVNSVTVNVAAKDIHLDQAVVLNANVIAVGKSKAQAKVLAKLFKANGKTEKALLTKADKIAKAVLADSTTGKSATHVVDLIRGISNPAFSIGASRAVHGSGVVVAKALSRALSLVAWSTGRHAAALKATGAKPAKPEKKKK